MYHQPQISFTPEEIIGYLRKSQSDDPLMTVEEVLAKHEAMLDEWSEKHLGGKVPEANKYREVVSGETLKDRPEIQTVLQRIESPKIKAVQVVEPQRLTRGDLEDIGRLMKLLKHTNTLVITLNRIYDLRDEYDWEAFERELKRGNEYLEYYKKIQSRGRMLSVSQGNYLGTNPPYGYRKITVMEGKRKCPTLEEDPEQAPVVRMIFDMYVNQDMGRNSICKRLDELCIKPPRGEHWSPAALKDMLENVHYIGKVKWNWRKTVTIVEDGEIIQTRPKAKAGEYLLYDGKHDGIIPAALFQAAQDKQGRNHRAKAKTKVRNPFAGLVFCRCGRAMSLRTYKNPDGTEKSAPRLLCDDQVHCNTGSILYSEMIDKICAILQDCITDFEIRLHTDTGESAKLHEKLIQQLEKKLAGLQAKELSQWEAQSDPDPDKRMPHHIFKQLNEKLQKEKDEVQQALRKAYESMPEPVDYQERITRFKEALSALRDPEIDAQRKNRLLKECIERIDYSRDKPQRLRSTTKRVTINGRRIKLDALPIGGSWTSPPVEINVKLKV